MTVALQPLRDVCAQLGEVGVSNRRELLITRLYRLAGPVREEQRALERKLNAGMDWLAANAGHPLHAEREGLWMRWEAEYRAITDLLETARLATRAPAGIAQPELPPSSCCDRSGTASTSDSTRPIRLPASSRDTSTSGTGERSGWRSTGS